MATVPASSGDGDLVELVAIGGDSMESFARLLDSQKELFHSQTDQLQKIVVAQCKLTGVNPLAQEMAAGALSINIGKKPRDLLNPKAIKYMQSIFALKDTIGKKETREISALCGVTVTQVREFFASQRSRVRKLVRLSREKATRLEASKVALDGCSSSLGQPLPLGEEASANSHTVDPMANQCSQAPNNYGSINAIQGVPQVSLNTTEPKTVQEAPSCSLPHEETIVGIDSEERKFLENIFNLMRKEETFSGQVKLMEWVLQIQNTAVLLWFLTKDGLAILSSWLSQAALEEQTSVLVVLFKVLCHLPLHKAIPEQMSVILQTVNKLRFYRSSDISNRARILLSRWSKILIRNQGLRKSSFPKSPKDAQKEIIRKQRIREILSDESWQSKIDIPEDILALTGNNDVNRSAEPKRGLKLLMAPGEESNKNNQSVSTSKSKQRRKVLLVEQPDRKSAGRGSLASRANQSRPMSADDIQKAKMRAMFMQNKYGKTDASSENHLQKTEDQESSASKTNKITPPPRTTHLPQLKRNEDNKLPIPPRKSSPVKTETDSKPNTSSVENTLERLKKSQIQWHSPPEMTTNSLWSVGAGENSKEVEVQMQRNRRDKETLYADDGCDIPPNPKEPWDVEMDFDDSLTPQVPIDQPPDADMPDVSSLSPCSPNGVGDTAEVTPMTSTSSSAPASNAPPGPDMELLAVLLKNPELVFALTSGQGTNLTSDQTVVLLDMLKKSGVGLAGAVNGTARSSRDAQEPTSLPSPTPPSESRSEWRSEPSPFTRNPPLLQPHLPGSRGAAIRPSVTPSTPPTFPSSVVGNQTQTTILSVSRLSSTINPSPQNLTHLNLVPQNPAPPIRHQVQSTIYPQQQISNPNVAFSAHHWPSPSGIPTRPQPAWPQATVGVVRRDHSPIAPEPSFSADQYNHRSMYTIVQSQPPSTATVAGQMVGRRYPPTSSRVETWSPEGSPGRPPELHSSTRVQGWNHGNAADQHNWQSRQADGNNRRRDRR